MPSRRKLRSETINVFHIDEYNRVLAFHRWVRGLGRDVVVAVSLREQSFENGSYNLGFPCQAAGTKSLIVMCTTFFPIPGAGEWRPNLGGRADAAKTAVLGRNLYSCQRC